MNKKVLIIGGGPAGMSCALWLSNYGLSPIICETKSHLGGMQFISNFCNKWFIGNIGETGHDIAKSFINHINYERIQVLLNTDVLSVNKKKDGFHISLNINNDIQNMIFSNIVIASGTKFSGDNWYKDIPGGENIKDIINIGPASLADNTKWFGLNPVIVGSGDNAAECSLFLIEKGAHPIVIIRNTLKSKKIYKDRLQEMKNKGYLTIHEHTTITSIKQNKKIILSNDEEYDFSSIFLMIGYEPNHISAIKNITNDENNYICVDGNCETNINGIYAIGDIANPTHPCVSTAIAMGTIAGRSIAKKY